MNAQFFQPDVATANSSPDDYCQACPQAIRGGFCGARIHPDCLRIDSRGGVRVSLSASPQTWFATISQFDEVLHLTRNRVAVFGQLGNSPVLGQWHRSPLPRDAEQGYMPNLAEYASLWAIRENSPMGAVYGLSVRDACGMEFERVMLPASADHELFMQFVVSFQSPPEEAGCWFPPNHTSSANRRTRLATRIPRLHSQWATGDRIVRRLPVRFVPKVLAGAARMKIQLRTTYYHPALIRTVTWTPQTLAETKRREGSLEFFEGDGVGLHLDRRGVGSVWLWTGRCSCCTEQRWQIEIGDRHEHIGLTIKAGDETPDSEWREMPKNCLP